MTLLQPAILLSCWKKNFQLLKKRVPSNLFEKRPKNKVKNRNLNCEFSVAITSILPRWEGLKLWALLYLPVAFRQFLQTVSCTYNNSLNFNYSCKLASAHYVAYLFRRKLLELIFRMLPQIQRLHSGVIYLYLKSTLQHWILPIPSMSFFLRFWHFFLFFDLPENELLHSMKELVAFFLVQTKLVQLRNQNLF